VENADHLDCLRCVLLLHLQVRAVETNGSENDLVVKMGLLRLVAICREELAASFGLLKLVSSENTMRSILA
jgi:hypothetical protein